MAKLKVTNTKAVKGKSGSPKQGVPDSQPKAKTESIVKSVVDRVLKEKPVNNKPSVKQAGRDDAYTYSKSKIKTAKEITQTILKPKTKTDGYTEEGYKPYVPKTKSTKKFYVDDQNSPRFKRYNDSLQQYNAGEAAREKTKKYVADRVKEYNKTKPFYKPEAEYAGEASKREGDEERVVQRVRYKKGTNKYSKSFFSPRDVLVDYDKKNMVRDASYVKPKPEYEPVYRSKYMQEVDALKKKLTQKRAMKAESKLVKPTEYKGGKVKVGNFSKPAKSTKSNSTFTVKKTSMAKPVAKTTAPKPAAKPMVKDTAISKPVTKAPVSKPIAKAVVKDTVATKPFDKTMKSTQKVPTIRHNTNYNNDVKDSAVPYRTVKGKLPAKKGPSQWKTTKKNYN